MKYLPIAALIVAWPVAFMIESCGTDELRRDGLEQSRRLDRHTQCVKEETLSGTGYFPDAATELACRQLIQLRREQR